MLGFGKRSNSPSSAQEVASDSPPDDTNVDARPVNQERGEGIGLSIVKRLCELLDASMEMDSTPGEGTSLRIVFPRRYHSAGHM